ncbi:SMI1/KNR4 family protein [Paenibacillus sp. NPDC057967]|uniref:SMI1/KNR4 family protein n=1 Tax=Paenibacillus sp. NPDC057967 TaxID=3346293 RepID=UPI0036DCEBF6
MWDQIFEREWAKFPGAIREEWHALQTKWNEPLSEQELREIRERQVNPFPVSSPYYALYKPLVPETWTFPKRALPESYGELLQYSNGGEFQTGDRHFQFFGTSDFRAMNLAYEFPAYMPGTVSFAMDGSGHHYIFDMRAEPRNGEYPILVAHSGNLGFEDCICVADSLQELCRGTEEISLP